MAKDQAAYKEKTKQRLHRRDARIAGKAKLDAAHAAAYKDREQATSGLKSSPRVLYQAFLQQDKPTCLLEEKLKSLLQDNLREEEREVLSTVEQQAEDKATQMIKEDERVGTEEEYKSPVIFTSKKTGKTYQYKPAQPGKLEWTLDHDDRCGQSLLMFCCTWQGKLESNCARKDPLPC